MAAAGILNLLGGLGGGGGGLLSLLGGLGGGLGSLGGLGALSGLGSLGGLGGTGSPGAGLDLNALGNIMSMMSQIAPASQGKSAVEEDSPIVDVEPEPLEEETAPPPKEEKSRPQSKAQEKKPALDTEQLLALLSALGKMSPPPQAQYQPPPNAYAGQSWDPGYTEEYTAPPEQSWPQAEYMAAEQSDYPPEEVQGDPAAYSEESPMGEAAFCHRTCGEKAFPSCQGCLLSCPRSGLLLPDYQEVRRRAAHWSRY
ncbi:MAG: hypothetical protein IJP07_00460 [Firmicutes bacterium]|nr:hypothetical protein [Bacillota bacterium]